MRPTLSLLRLSKGISLSVQTRPDREGEGEVYTLSREKLTFAGHLRLSSSDNNYRCVFRLFFSSHFSLVLTFLFRARFSIALASVSRFARLGATEYQSSSINLRGTREPPSRERKEIDFSNFPAISCNTRALRNTRILMKSTGRRLPEITRVLFIRQVDVITKN